MTTELEPAYQESLGRLTKKGLGAFVVVIFLIGAGATALHLRTGDPIEPAFDAGAVVLLFTTVRSYSRAVVAERVRIAEDALKQKKPDQARAALTPLLTPLGRRFDRTGAVPRLLARADEYNINAQT